jgi:hypothetical protein
MFMAIDAGKAGPVTGGMSDITHETDDETHTLGELADRELGLTLECPRCHHRQRMFRDALIARHGRNVLVDAVARAAVCSRCRKRGATARIVTPRSQRPAVA